MYWNWVLLGTGRTLAMARFEGLPPKVATTLLTKASMSAGAT
jgi:hypothetical protein